MAEIHAAVDGAQLAGKRPAQFDMSVDASKRLKTDTMVLHPTKHSALFARNLQHANRRAGVI